MRSRMLAHIRHWFAEHGVMEVETPLLSVAGTTDPAIESFSVHAQPDSDGDALRYLQTSPEFAMKRLLAAGSGPIYQLCKVFRSGEQGRLHNPEFTLLEWYRPGRDYRWLMDEVERVIADCLKEWRTLPRAPRLTYRELFQQYLGIDPLVAGVGELRACAGKYEVDPPASLDSGDTGAWLDLLLTHAIEPALPKGPLFVYDYPAEHASLAKVRPGPPAVAERFELYIDGMEIANGFTELTDAEEQRSRFARDDEIRRQRGQAAVPADERLLGALGAGLPDSAGVAVGVDRLIMIATGAARIEEVLAFDFDHA